MKKNDQNRMAAAQLVSGEMNIKELKPEAGPPTGRPLE